VCEREREKERKREREKERARERERKRERERVSVRMCKFVRVQYFYIFTNNMCVRVWAFIPYRALCTRTFAWRQCECEGYFIAG